MDKPQRKLILLVDDESDQLDTMERLLRRRFRVLKVTRGDEALDLMDDLDVDIVVADLHMPGMSGMDLVREIRAVEGPPVVLISGDPNLVSMVSALPNQPALLKPFDGNALVEAIDSVLPPET